MHFKGLVMRANVTALSLSPQRATEKGKVPEDGWGRLAPSGARTFVRVRPAGCAGGRRPPGMTPAPRPPPLGSRRLPSASPLCRREH